MDLETIGKFIKSQRKEKKLTQAQLAEKLYVSEKTVSKWECGNGFPDASIMLALCKELDISANELLCGKKLTNEEYKQQAEQNIMSLKASAERNVKFMLTIECVLGFMTSLSFFVLIFVASFANLENWIRIVLIVFGLIQFAIGVHFCLSIEKNAGFYECKHCHNKYIPTYKQVLWSMHMGRTRYMECPNCHKKSWQKKVTK